MRCLNKNIQFLQYSLLLDKKPITKVIDGVERKTGETKIEYSYPTPFKVNFSLSGGDARTVEYGIDLSQYDAVIVCNKGTVPITETSLIWKDTKPTFKGDKVDPASADYKVVKCVKSLNHDKYILKKLVKNNGTV